MKKIILVGHGASGKDYLKNELVENYSYIKYGVSHTSRPIRNNEKNGYDYYFVSEITFKEMIDKNTFIDYKNYNNWYYGLSKETFDNSNLFILTPDNINCLSNEQRKLCNIIFLDIPYELRKERLSKRNDADSVDRRLTADYTMFKNFTDYDIRLTSNQINLSKILELLNT